MKRLSPWLRLALAGLPFLAACAIGFAAAGPPEAASLSGGESRPSALCYGYSGVLNLPLGGPTVIQPHTLDLAACPAPSGMTVSSISVKVYFNTDFVTGGKQCSGCFAQLNIILSSSSVDDVLRVCDTNCCPEFPHSAGDVYTCIFEADSASFNGLDVHGSWTIAAQNACVHHASYTLKGWEIWVNYDLPSPTPTRTATPTPTPRCWTFRGTVYEDFYGGQYYSLPGVQVTLRGAATPYPFDPGVSLGSGTSTADGDYSISTCETDGTWDYYRLELQVPPGFVAIDASSNTGTVKSNSVIEFAGGIDARDLGGNNFWLRRLPTATPTPTRTRTVSPPPASRTPTLPAFRLCLPLLWKGL